MGRRGKKKKKQQQQQQQQPGPEPEAQAASRKSLRQRLRTRMKLQKSFRASGQHPGFSRTLAKLQQSPEESLELATGMKAEMKKKRRVRKAKKDLRSLAGMMNPEEAKSFARLASQVSSDSGNNMFKNLATSATTQSPHPTPTLAAPTNPAEAPRPYRPSSGLSLEEKKQRRALRKTVDPTRKKKVFTSVKVHVPKLHEVGRPPSSGTKTPAPAWKTHDTSAKKAAFKVHAWASSLTWQSVRHRLDEFQPELADSNLRSFMWNSVSARLVRVCGVRPLPISQAGVPIPHTEQACPATVSVPTALAPHLQKPGSGWVHQKRDEWCFRTDEQGQVRIARSAFRAAVAKLVRVTQLCQWLRSRQGHKVPWTWCLKFLAQLGVLPTNPVPHARGRFDVTFVVLLSPDELPPRRSSPPPVRLENPQHHPQVPFVKIRFQAT